MHLPNHKPALVKRILRRIARTPTATLARRKNFTTCIAHDTTTMYAQKLHLRRTVRSGVRRERRVDVTRRKVELSSWQLQAHCKRPRLKPQKAPYSMWLLVVHSCEQTRGLSFASSMPSEGRWLLSITGKEPSITKMHRSIEKW